MSAPSPAESRAVEVLRRGGVVLHATEGVWGFACDPFKTDSVARILKIKQRDAAKGFIVIAAEARLFEHELTAISQAQRAFVQAAWPGPVTQILPVVEQRFGPLITGGRATIAARIPGHRQARAVAARFGGVLVSTSANVSGAEPVLSYAEAVSGFGHDVDYVLPGAVDKPGKPSRIYAPDGKLLRG